MASIRSNIPPCPGKSFPESLICKLLLKSDSNKSPRIEAIATMNAAMSQNNVDVSVKNAIVIPANAVNPIPTKVPSHVFLGEILRKSDFFPKKRPPKYAKVSLVQVSNKGVNAKMKDSCAM